MDPRVIAALRANAQAPRRAPMAQWRNGEYVLVDDAPKKKGGRGGTPTSLISEGGALAGAIIGQAAIPIPFVGAGIGGAVGGFLGRLGENKIRDDEYKLGSAIGEGAVSGVLSGGPLKLLKGGYTASKAALAGERALPALGKQFTRGATTSLLTKVPGTKQLGTVAQRLESRAAGVGVGQKIPGKEPLWPDATKNVLRTMKDYGANVGARDAAAGKLQVALKGAQSKLGSAIQKNNRLLSKTEVNTLLKNYRQAVKSSHATKDVLEHAAEYEKLIRKGVKQLGDVPGLRTTLYQDAINFGRNSASAVPGREKAAKTLSKTLNKFLDDVSPAVRAADKEVSRLRVAGDYAVNAAGRLTSASYNQGGSMAGRLLTGDTGQALKGRIGEFGERALVRRAPLSTKAGLATRIAAGKPLTASPPQESPMGVQAPPSLTGALTQVNQGAPQQQPQQSPYPLENALMDIQRDPTNQKKYMDYYNFVNKAMEGQGGGGAGPNVTKVTAQQYGLAQSGAQGLQELSQYLQRDPSVLHRTATPGRGLPIVGGYIARGANTGDYDAIGYNIADKYLRLTTGAQANASEIKNLQTKIMPRAGDDPETVRTKLAQLQQYFDSILGLAGNGGAQEPGLQELSEYGGYGAL